MTRVYDVPKLIDKYAGKRFGSWVIGKDFHKNKSHWFVDVLCDCGETNIVNISCIKNHGNCTCDYLKKIREKKAKDNSKTDLETIWPKVVKAGRKVMEKYKKCNGESLSKVPRRKAMSF